MERFAFILHPLTAKDFSRKFKFAKNWPDTVVEAILRRLPPFKVSHITGVRSPWGEAEGWFIACPLTSRQMLELPEEFVTHRIVQAGQVAQKLGAGIVGLGAFTSVVGDAGVSVARNLDIAVTSGNSYTVATAIAGTEQAAELMGIRLKSAELLVLGATGSIGAVCARMLAPKVGRLTLAARHIDKLDALAASIRSESGLQPRVSTEVKQALRDADVIIAVTSAIDAIIEPEDLKVGAVVCDVSRPRNVSKRVAEVRDDVLVIEGGVVKIPGAVEFGINFGFPEGTAYACMAETMILSLEKRCENFSLGRDISIKQVETILKLAQRHGFALAGLRSFETAVTVEQIATIRENANRRRTDTAYCAT